MQQLARAKCLLKTAHWRGTDGLKTHLKTPKDQLQTDRSDGALRKACGFWLSFGRGRGQESDLFCSVLILKLLFLKHSKNVE